MAFDPIAVADRRPSPTTASRSSSTRSRRRRPRRASTITSPAAAAGPTCSCCCSTTSAGATSAATAAAWRVGAPTPNIDRLARQGLLLTSCYSEPSCTPSGPRCSPAGCRCATACSARPMYGEPGGLQGEVTLAQLLSDAGYVTQAVGKWHLGENIESQPQNVGFDDFYGFLSVSRHVHRVAGPALLPRDRLLRGPHRVGREPAVQPVLRPRHARRRAGARRGGDDPRPLPRSTTRGRPTPRTSSGAWPAATGPGSSTTAPAAPTSTTTRTSASSARRRPSTPTRTRSSSSTTSSAVCVAALEETGQLEDTLDLPVVRQRAPHGDLARRRLHAVPLRQGLDLGGRRAGARASLVVAGDDRGRTGRATACSPSPTCCPTVLAPGGGAEDRVPDRPLHRRRRPDLVPARRPTGSSNRKFQYYWLLRTSSARARAASTSS